MNKKYKKKEKRKMKILLFVTVSSLNAFHLSTFNQKGPSAWDNGEIILVDHQGTSSILIGYHIQNSDIK